MATGGELEKKYLEGRDEVLEERWRLEPTKIPPAILSIIISDVILDFDSHYHSQISPSEWWYPVPY